MDCQLTQMVIPAIQQTTTQTSAGTCPVTAVAVAIAPSEIIEKALKIMGLFIALRILPSCSCVVIGDADYSSRHP